MKNIHNLLLCCIVFVLFTHQNLLAQQAPRLKTSFDANWKFHLGHAANASKDFNYGIANIFSKTGKAENTAIDPKFNDSDWRSLNLPHDWAVELPFANSPNFDVMAHGYKPIGGLFPETSIGWYRKWFTINQADSGQRFALQFDGIFRDAQIWVNGYFAGSNASGYLGCTIDITDYLNYRKPNVVTVRVDATQYEGWFYEGAGIYRHVWLLQYHDLHLVQDGLFIQTFVKPGQADITAEIQIQNQTLAATNCTVECWITDRAGKRIAKSNESETALSLNETKTLLQNVQIAQPRLWSLEDPYLYRFTVVIKQGQQIIDKLTTPFGVRAFSMTADKGLLLNGKPIKLKGVNCHQDHAGLGSALPDYMNFYRLNLLKQLGVNAYRTSHNAPAPELLDACDSLGILVMDETRLLNSSPEYTNQLRNLIRRDRNHPSIFMWSIGNEEGYVQKTGIGKRLALNAIAQVKELDPSRTCTYAADLANEFEGINEVIPVRGFNYRHKALVDYHNDHPTQPIIGTEMGSTVTTRGIYVKDSIRCYVPDQDITAPWWASKAEDWWPIAAENPWMSGGFVWTGFDYRGEPTPYHWPNINSHFGIMDMCGFPKNIYYYYQSWWKDEDVLHISPHWNWTGSEGKPIEVWVNSNADKVELLLNGKSLGTKPMARNSHLKWDVPYEPGKLQAIGFKGQREFQQSIETTSPAFELVVYPSKTTLFADGKDVSVINISAIDNQGREVPDANNLVHFNLSGDGQIVGVGNGDPSSHEPDQCEPGKWSRSLFNGKCQLILQAGTTPDKLKLEATSEGLWKAGTEIHSIKPIYPTKPIDAVISPTVKPGITERIGKILGADISFLPQLEHKGIKFQDNGEEKDAIQILKDHGFNYIRLRVFVDPAHAKGYSPNEGFCDLKNTLAMAKRVKDAGLKLLLDFHYSDYWADPQQQFKPNAWEGMQMPQLSQALKDYTHMVIRELAEQGTTPDMVQIGNEINHGMVWPEGHIGNADNLANLLKAGIEGVKKADPNILIMLHVALGGQHDESIFWFDNMFSRGVDCDLIGLSYYPRWHGTLGDLRYNMNLIIQRYHKPINVVEYSHMKTEVNQEAFALPDNMGTGTFIWEPLNTWDQVFDKDGKPNSKLMIYDKLAKRFLPSSK